ncbi:uncharacterized protein LOC116159187 [Photinus pyralis]|uniref:uncharacterized protein LOC116159187 n=1 Tax=Photinus pyralis TaxID=7054 RepID=UPI00126779E9|nr:uncharacterized protein LOC116159187 [Photinus pyralis]XP_031327990.1 uncharacterized protein LOC116159187 [Photinus pyralis]
MSSGESENLPLTTIHKEEKENTENEEVEDVHDLLQHTSSENHNGSPTDEKIITIQTRVPKNRRKVSKSITDIFFRNNKRAKRQKSYNVQENGNELTVDKNLKSEQCDESSAKSLDDVDGNSQACTKGNNQHSTSTSTFDDGYESYNSTPLGSGKIFDYIFCIAR